MDHGSDGIETLWDARDVARYLKVSRSWVYQKAEAGLLPYLKVGGLVRFVPERIREFALGSSSGMNPGPYGLGNRLPGGR
jgi:excisionase family DNA binding protein